MIAPGAQCYQHGAYPSTGTGNAWTAEELDAAINGKVSSLVSDETGKANIKELLSSVAETSFEQKQLAEALTVPDKVENWRVGEAIAEAYLTEHRACLFPWPDCRDERKNGSSLPGADLVGLQKDEQGDRFVFGEVKTSSEDRNPPGALYGRTGLKQQLEDLRDDNSLRNTLFRYLAHRATKADWQDRFKAASKRYLNNSSDIQLFGFLVRDVEPNMDDVRVRVDRLGKGCPVGTQIELIALYLPTGAIDSLATKALATQAGGGA